MSEGKMKYDVYRREYWENDEERNAAEEWEYAGTTYAVSTEKAINNVRWRLLGNKSQYLPSVVNGKDAFGWEWKAEEIGGVLDGEAKKATSNEQANPYEIMTSFANIVDGAKNSGKRSYASIDKIIATFVWRLYNEYSKGEERIRHISQPEIARFFGWDVSVLEDALNNSVISAITDTLLIFIRQYEKWFAMAKIKEPAYQEIIKITNAWMEAFKRRGTR